jgi:hypothetical protein
MNLKTRLARLEARVRPRERSLAEMPYSELWLELLRCVKELHFAKGPREIVRRLPDGIAFLETYQARGTLGANVEQICEEWVFSFDDATNRGAFMDTDIAQVLRERDRMDQESVAATGATA